MRGQRGYLCNFAVAPSQERGLKYRNLLPCITAQCRSFAGAWIEIFQILFFSMLNLVAPSQERGLKYKVGMLWLLYRCRSFAGAWIEMPLFYPKVFSYLSLLRRSVDWNTGYEFNGAVFYVAPSQERGLKSQQTWQQQKYYSSLLRRGVDWNQPLLIKRYI